MRAPPCSLCGDESAGRFALDRGCVARPDLLVQHLCPHHALRSTPLGSFELVEDLTLSQNLAEVLRGGSTRPHPAR